MNSQLGSFKSYLFFYQEKYVQDTTALHERSSKVINSGHHKHVITVTKITVYTANIIRLNMLNKKNIWYEFYLFICIYFFFYLQTLRYWEIFALIFTWNGLKGLYLESTELCIKGLNALINRNFSRTIKEIILTQQVFYTKKFQLH